MGHACRLFKTKKLCTTASIRDKYIQKIEYLTETSVGAFSTTNTAFTDAFTGLYAEGRMRIMPKSNTCTKYVIYARELNADGVEESNAALLDFAFDKGLN